jgi:hypothetical protein
MRNAEQNHETPTNPADNLPVDRHASARHAL